MEKINLIIFRKMSILVLYFLLGWGPIASLKELPKMLFYPWLALKGYRLPLTAELYIE